MSTRATPDVFLRDSDIPPEKIRRIVQEGLIGADFGELYRISSQARGLQKTKGEYVDFSTVEIQGFSFRAGQGIVPQMRYHHSFNEAALRRTISEVRHGLSLGISGNAPLSAGFGRHAGPFYPPPADARVMDVGEVIRKIDEIEAYAYSLDPHIENVSIFYKCGHRDVQVVTADGQELNDSLPTTSMHITLTVKNDRGERETGFVILGGRVLPQDVLLNDAVWQAGAKKALEIARLLLVAAPAPGGTMDVVLKNGWPAVLLHEAVGHGMEGDFNRKGTSVYSCKVGQKVASDVVTIVDQGNMPGERGSLHMDDEGTPTGRTVLVENGVLRGYMQDRMNARLMGADPTGNGRRESHAAPPIPRMTNTYFEPGPHDPQEIIASVDNGIYITDMGGGQVDIVNGKFVMSATLAFRVRGGKIEEPVKGATLVGDGLSVIQTIRMMGNDLTMERSAGMCGKDGQSVVVGCGQPTLCVSGMTVIGPK